MEHHHALPSAPGSGPAPNIGVGGGVGRGKMLRPPSAYDDSDGSGDDDSDCGSDGDGSSSSDGEGDGTGDGGAAGSAGDGDDEELLHRTRLPGRGPAVPFSGKRLRPPEAESDDGDGDDNGGGSESQGEEEMSDFSDADSVQISEDDDDEYGPISKPAAKKLKSDTRLGKSQRTPPKRQAPSRSADARDAAAAAKVPAAAATPKARAKPKARASSKDATPSRRDRRTSSSPAPRPKAASKGKSAAEKEQDEFNDRVARRTEEKLRALKRGKGAGTGATPPMGKTPSPANGTPSTGGVSTPIENEEKVERVPTARELVELADRYFSEGRKLKHTADDLDKQAAQMRAKGQTAEASKYKREGASVMLRSCFKFLLASAGYKEKGREYSARAKGYTRGTPEHAALVNKAAGFTNKADEMMPSTINLLDLASKRLQKVHLPALEVIALAVRAAASQRQLLSRLSRPVSSQSRREVAMQVLGPAHMDPAAGKVKPLSQDALNSLEISIGSVAKDVQRVHRDSKDSAAACSAWQALQVATSVYEDHTPRTEEATKVLSSASVLTRFGGNVPYEDMAAHGIGLLSDFSGEAFNAPFVSAAASARAEFNARRMA